MTETEARQPGRRDRLIGLAVWFWIGWAIGDGIAELIRKRPGRHRVMAQPVFSPGPDDGLGHAIVVPPEPVGCECWCHRPSERIGF